MSEVPGPEDRDYYEELLTNSWVSYDEEDEIDYQCQAEDENEGMDLDSPFECGRSDQADPAFYEEDLPPTWRYGSCGETEDPFAEE